LRLRSQVLATATAYFEEHGFIQTHPPIISSSDCEGAGEVFSVEAGKNFFREPKYLAVSSQLHLEALASAVGKVWSISPTFRAEKSDTPRHLSEFYMLEVECNFTDTTSAIMDDAEHLLQAIAARLVDSQLGRELLVNCESSNVLQTRWRGLQKGNWPRISYSDAIKVLQRRDSFEFPPQLGVGLHAEHERHLAQEVGNNGPVFVTDYPRDIKAFYMAPSNLSSATVACFDLLVPDLCEIAGGSLREHRLEALLESMDRHGMLKEGGTRDTMQADELDKASRVPENLAWYTDLRRYGSVPHGGFGVGFDRLLCYLAGVSSVRDMVAFPRYHGRCDC
jgi:asparaginyl-tRNA synthetase